VASSSGASSVGRLENVGAPAHLTAEFLDSSLRDDDGWMAYARYTVAMGTQPLEWVEARRVKAVSLEVRPKLSS
jgi:hypothetical protein